MFNPKADARGAFTLIELLVVIAIIAILASLMLPALTSAKSKAQDVQCVSHLKQVAVGLKLFATDHDGHYPWHTPQKEGGTYGPLAGQGWRNFIAASNELASPKILACPSDRSTSFAVTWSSGPNGFANANRRNLALSFFAGLDAFELLPATLLAGDRNLTGGEPDECRSVSPAPGVNAILLKRDNTRLGWSSDLHKSRGNILAGDGSVEHVPAKLLNARVNEASQELADKFVVTQSGAIPNNHILLPR